jgi:MIF4G domain
MSRSAASPKEVTAATSGAMTPPRIARTASSQGHQRSTPHRTNSSGNNELPANSGRWNTLSGSSEHTSAKSVTPNRSVPKRSRSHVGQGTSRDGINGSSHHQQQGKRNNKNQASRSMSPHMGLNSNHAARSSQRRPRSRTNSHDSMESNHPPKPASIQRTHSGVLRFTATPLAEVDLYHDSSNKVIRYSADALLQYRIHATARSSPFLAHERCTWTIVDENNSSNEKKKKNSSSNNTTSITDQERIARIWKETVSYMDYVPLLIDDSTRWKPKSVMLKQQQQSASPWNVANNISGDESRFDEGCADSGLASTPSLSETEQQLSKAIGILNKLSWTNMPRLTGQFLEALSSTMSTSEQPGPLPAEEAAGSAAVLSKAMIQKSMSLIVQKAMMESHFAELYASFCSKLATLHKAFKKTLLQQCQEQFEKTIPKSGTDSSSFIVPAHIQENALEAEFYRNKLKRQSIGLMQFIGELYKLQLIKHSIMIGCLQRLLFSVALPPLPNMDSSTGSSPNHLSTVDEEKLECFIKLMSTIGEKLDTANPGPKAPSKSDSVELSGNASVPNAQEANTAETSKMWRRVYALGGHSVPEDLRDSSSSASSEEAGLENRTVCSSRIKFLIVDLIELRDSGWKQRRAVEKARTIEEIHAQVQAEQRAEQFATEQSSRRQNHPPMKRSMSSGGGGAVGAMASRQQHAWDRRSQSGGGRFATPERSSSGIVRRTGSASPTGMRPPIFVSTSSGGPGDNHRAATTSDGFTEVQRSTRSLRRTRSDGGPSLLGSLSGAHGSDDAVRLGAALTSRMLSDLPDHDDEDHSSSLENRNLFLAPDEDDDEDHLSLASFASSHQRSAALPEMRQLLQNTHLNARSGRQHLKPEECGEKFTTILKEYFVGGDLAEVVISIDEMVGYPGTGHAARASKVLETGILLVMERKLADVRKFVIAIGQCFEQYKMDGVASIPKALKDPLEFLRDIEIDAPMAATYFAMVLADWLQRGVISLRDALITHSPELFRSDGRPAEFAVQILATRYKNVDTTDEVDVQYDSSPTSYELEVVKELMNEHDRSAHPDVSMWIEERKAAL